MALMHLVHYMDLRYLTPISFTSAAGPGSLLLIYAFLCTLLLGERVRKKYH